MHQYFQLPIQAIGNLAKCPTGASYRSQLLPLLPGSPKSQASVLPCKKQGQRKLCLPAIECSSSFPIDRSVSQLYTCPQRFSCDKCRASSSCSFIRVAHRECSCFPKQQRFFKTLVHLQVRDDSNRVSGANLKKKKVKRSYFLDSH